MGVFTGTAWTDIFNGTAGDDTMYGLDGDDYLWGYGGNDRLEGGAGNDMLDGGTGDDVMIGGTGNDTYYVDSVGDVVTELAGGGTDTVVTYLSTYTMPANIEILDLRSIWPIGTVNATGNALANTFIMGWGAVTVNGLGGNDTVNYFNMNAVTVDLLTGVHTGDAADDTFISIENVTGTAYSDELRGNNGANVLDGWDGADVLIGRAGNDAYIVDDVGDVVIENAGEGTDEVRTKGLSTYTLPANVENLVNTTQTVFTGYGNALNNNITGGYLSDWLYGLDGNDYLNGGNGNDHLYGGAGHDTLYGSYGLDELVGGAGNDAYIIDHQGDTIVEEEDGGIDSVYASLEQYSLPDNVENLNANLTGVNFHGIGNAGDNVIWGLGGNDTLEGGEGNDELRGQSGDDILLGGLGDDLLVGGAGKDVMVGYDGADTFRFSSFESGTGEDADTIWGFIQGDDRIDLVGVDANIFAAGDQAFAFIGDAVFSGSAGELRYEYDGTYTWLQADVNGDGVSDFDIRLGGEIILTGNDFLL